jgi:hypothetical protein
LVDSASEMLHRPQNWLARVAAASMMSVRHEGHMLCASFAYEAERVHAARHCRWKLCPQRRVSLPVGSGRRQMAQSAAAPAGCVLFGCCTGSPAGLPPSSTSILPALAPHNRAPAPSPAMVAPGWRPHGGRGRRQGTGWLAAGRPSRGLRIPCAAQRRAGTAHSLPRGGEITGSLHPPALRLQHRQPGAHGVQGPHGWRSAPAASAESRLGQVHRPRRTALGRRIACWDGRAQLDRSSGRRLGVGSDC